MRAKRTVTVLGATGSVGQTTCTLLAEAPERFQVEALTGNRNAAQMIRLARQLKPAFIAMTDAGAAEQVRETLAGSGVDVQSGDAAVLAAAERPVDWVMAAIVGAAGLRPTLAAARHGATVALANKESLVCAGHLLTAVAKSAGGRLLPVDSEHNAIFQVFDAERPAGVARIILTASGGPFRIWNEAEMAAATPTQALRHPNWDMGAKITIDSATMFNKGLELIEAGHLFAMPEDRIDVVVHPQSIVHSLVSYRDGSVLAQLGLPDMRTPVAVTLYWPERADCAVEQLDLTRMGDLTFEAPDESRFPALRLAREAMRAGGTAPAVLNAANEAAVHAFLAGEIGFLDIAAIVAICLDRIPAAALDSLEAVWEADRTARAIAQETIHQRRRVILPARAAQ
jgi:1-deoxy-D-xylulose-5-phosphate reductoisomerase